MFSVFFVSDTCKLICLTIILKFMPKAIRRLSLRKKEGKRILRLVSKSLGIEAEEIFGRKPRIEVVNVKGRNIYFINGIPMLVISEDTVFPTLVFSKYVNSLPKVVVDMGAVPHICNGADVMAPGIVEINGEFKKNDLVAVVDERNRRVIAMAQALACSEKLKNLKKGKAFKNLHHVGDDIWDLVKESSQR
ncbi:RNA-binding protein [Candidatus Bathyarchaeota archaeon]|nr:MAG: RNA-binding protein [Candidatus Bathyarchaeota archaeon]